MAKLVKTYTDEYHGKEEKIELTFNGEVYDYTMRPITGGRKADKPCFDTQVVKRHPSLENSDHLLELLERLSFEEGASDILEILTELADYEDEEE